MTTLPEKAEPCATGPAPEPRAWAPHHRARMRFVASMLFAVLAIFGSLMLIPWWKEGWQVAALLLSLAPGFFYGYKLRGFTCPRCGKDFHRGETTMHYYFVRQCRVCGIGVDEQG